MEDTTKELIDNAMFGIAPVRDGQLITKEDAPECPRCKTDNVSIEKHVEGRYFAQCKDPNCGESSGCCDTETEAFKLWSAKHE